MKTTISYILIGISIIIMLIYGLRNNNNFINISKVIKEHFMIFGGAKKHIIVLYIMPMIMSIGIGLTYSFGNSMIEAIMVVISVVISALLAFQGGILNIGQNQNSMDKEEILNETNASINFTVLINIFLVFLMLIYIALEDIILKSIFTSIISYILLITFLTILIIIKRIRTLLKN